MSVSGALIGGITEVPVFTDGYSAFLKSDRFNRGSQIASIAMAVGGVAYLVFASFQSDPQVYGLCIVITLFCGQNAWSLQRVIELGGYERQNARLEMKVDVLSRKVNEFALEIRRMQGEVTRFETENTRLSQTRTELAAEVDRLRSVQAGLQGVVTSLSGSADLTEQYVKKEQELQVKHRELLGREEALAKEEDALLKRLATDVGRLEEIVGRKKETCMALVKRVIPLSLSVKNLIDRMVYIRSKQPELAEEARLAIRARRV